MNLSRTLIIPHGIKKNNNVNKKWKFLKNYKPPVSSKVYAGDGDLVADFSKEKRIFVPYRSIPNNVINSFLSESITLVLRCLKLCPLGIKDIFEFGLKPSKKDFSLCPRH